MVTLNDDLIIMKVRYFDVFLLGEITNVMMKTINS